VETSLEQYFTVFNTEKISSNSIRTLGVNASDVTLAIKKSSQIPLGDCTKIAQKISELNKDLDLMQDIETKVSNV